MHFFLIILSLLGLGFKTLRGQLIQFFVSATIIISFLIVSFGSLSDSKSPQVYRTLLNILPDLNNIVVWMVSSCPLISKSSRPFYQAFGYCSQCTNSHCYDYHLQMTVIPYFLLSGKVLVPIALFDFFYFYSGLSVRQSQLISRYSFFIYWLSLGLVVWPGFGVKFGS